jgi:L-fuconolactonase
VVSADTVRYPHAANPPFETPGYVHPVEDLVDGMVTAGVTRAAVVQPFGIYATDNSYQADVAADRPDLLVGICGVPITREAPDILRYWVRERGMAGGRVITLGQGTTLHDRGVEGVCRAAEEVGVPLCLLTSRKHVPDVPALASRVPGLRIVLDHVGVTGARVDADDVIERLSGVVRAENVYLKVTTSLLLAGDDGRRVLDFVLDGAGPTRILWGTNYPVTDLGGYAATVAASRSALQVLSEPERERILSGTASELWPSLVPAASG